jgi:tetratricopeptide (TPR) repeat protein
MSYIWRSCLCVWIIACGGSATQQAPQAAPASSPASLETLPVLKETDKASSQPSDDKISPQAKADYQRGVTLVASAPEEAIAAFESAFKREPAYCAARVNAAILKERAKRVNEAETDYKNAIGLQPTCGAAWAGWAKIHLRSGRVTEADYTVRKGLGASPNDLLLRNTLAEVMLQDGKTVEAEAQALQVLKLDERNVYAMLNLSRSYAAQRKPELARLAAENAQAVEPGNAEVLHHLGVLLLSKSERAKALSLFRRAAFLRPDLVASQINLSQLLGEAGDYEAALKAAETALSYLPDAPRARLAVANALRGVQRYRDAEQGYQKLLDPSEKTPEGAAKDALYNLAILYLDAELPGIELEARLELAIKQFTSYLDRFKPSADEAQAINGYVLQAKRQIESEKKRKERDEKRRVKDAEKKAVSAQSASAPSASSLPSSLPTQPSSRPK